MSTVARRTFRSSPHRDAHQTWVAMVDLLTRAGRPDARAELLAVSGIAASVISDQAPKEAPIVVTCDGPRTRIYCLYDDDAVEGSDANEDALGFDPLKGDWRLSLPCQADDLDWVRGALKLHGSRITARGPDEPIAADDGTAEKAAGGLVLDPRGFLGS